MPCEVLTRQIYAREVEREALEKAREGQDEEGWFLQNLEVNLEIRRPARRIRLDCAASKQWQSRSNQYYLQYIISKPSSGG